MNRIRSTRTAAAAVALVVGVGLAGCAAGGTNDAADKTRSTSTAEASTPSAPAVAPAPAPTPVDLSGNWKQTNSSSADSYQSATISNGTIEVDWVSDGGSTTALYWAGTVTGPADAADSFSWTSAGDESKLQSSALASQDSTKEFHYQNGQISYSVSALGVTKTVTLGRS